MHELGAGACMRARGLTAACHLNAAVDAASWFDRIAGSYNVGLVKADAAGTFERKDFTSVPMLEDVALRCEELASNGIGSSRAWQRISRPDALPVSMDIPQATRLL